jgi:hypothetical protein
LSDFDRFKVSQPLEAASLILRLNSNFFQVQKARQSRARTVRGGVRKATKGKAPAPKAAGGKK